MNILLNWECKSPRVKPLCYFLLYYQVLVPHLPYNRHSNKYVLNQSSKPNIDFIFMDMAKQTNKTHTHTGILKSCWVDLRGTPYPGRGLFLNEVLILSLRWVFTNGLPGGLERTKACEPPTPQEALSPFQV